MRSEFLSQCTSLFSRCLTCGENHMGSVDLHLADFEMKLSHASVITLCIQSQMDLMFDELICEQDIQGVTLNVGRI